MPPGFARNDTRALPYALGITQLVAWGPLFYSIAVLWPAIARDLGLSRTEVFSVVSMCLLINGLVAPFAGRLIDRAGGRVVMSAGSVLAALAFAILTIADTVWVYVLGWGIGGVAMSFALYDPAFATLSQHSRTNYRRSMAIVTLIAGFASTVFWPLTGQLQSALGWQATFAVFGALQLLVCLPLHWYAIPRFSPESGGQAAERVSPDVATLTSPKLEKSFVWLALSFSTHSFVMSVVTVHLLTILQARGLSFADALLVGMAIGPAQMFIRLLDLGWGAKLKTRLLGTIAFAVLTLGMLLLVSPAMSFPIALGAAIAYGFGNGLTTILRGLAVAQLFGREHYGAWMGRLGRWFFLFLAGAPLAFALLLSIGLKYDHVGWLLAVLSMLALWFFRRALP